MDKLNTYYDVYADIQARTNGELYLGIVGPVRSGKSTFIKKFMDLLVIPTIMDPNVKARTIDELPQSADGKTIMTTEPKFIPKDAADLTVMGEKKGKVRLIDCVGFMVSGAEGTTEGTNDRLVKTPWQEEPIPFAKAAEIGTRKVIREHSNIGLIITTDGSFGELKRSDYEKAEEKAIDECKAIGKPFVILLNTTKPFSEETRALVNQMEKKYDRTVMPLDCQNLKKDEINHIMETVLADFPISKVEFNIPKWVEFLPNDHWLKADLIEHVKEYLKKIHTMQDVTPDQFPKETKYIRDFHIQQIKMENGVIQILVEFEDEYYYQILSDMIGVPIEGEYDLIETLKELSANRNEYEKLAKACSQVKGKGYGIVTPTREEIQIANPELIKHGNKYGVKIKAICPSIHMIQANIETEIAPIVGSEVQANDLIQYIQSNAKENADGIFDTNIFGKTIRELVDDGIHSKVTRLTEDSQIKLQETIQKVINDSNGGLVCIII